MPKINVEHLYVAKYAEGTEVDGKYAPVYSEGRRLYGVRKAEYKPTVSENPYFAEGVQQGTDNTISGADVSYEYADFENEEVAFLLGRQTREIDGTQFLITTSSDPAPFLGVGYVFELLKGVKKEYKVRILPKVQFRAMEDNVDAKEANISWQYYTLPGKAMPEEVGERDIEWTSPSFTDKKEAIALLEKILKVTKTTEQTAG